jgi:hypothetical protein
MRSSRKSELGYPKLSNAAQPLKFRSVDQFPSCTINLFRQAKDDQSVHGVSNSLGRVIGHP